MARGAVSPRRWLALLGVAVLLRAQSFSYTRDCNDQQHREVQCIVRPTECDDDLQFAHVNDTELLPDEAHDIRVAAVAKAVSSKRKGDLYQLSVDISWQTPPNNSTRLLQGFLLEINSDDGKQHQCFLFDVSGSNWTSETVSLSPRLHFSTESLFRFAQTYEIAVHSLPESAEITRTAQKKVTMPLNPRSPSHSNLLPTNCSHSSHPFASQWAAGFKRVVAYPLTRTVHIEFIAAPPEYCFEQYELNMTYTPTVIPMETSANGRCLCPVRSPGQSKSSNVVCTCVNSESRKIKLTKIDAAQTICVGCSNDTVVPLGDVVLTPDANNWILHLALFFALLVMLFLAAGLLIGAYRRYRTWGKVFRIQLIHDRNRSPSLSFDSHQAQALLKPSSLLRTANVNVLIVYAHDSPEHDSAVLALANYLQDVFSFDVHMDVFDRDVIDANLMDYLSSSVVNADYVLIINSLGMAKRYHTKIQSTAAKEGYVVERNDHIPLDALFVSQIDMALQHKNLISVRFNYSDFGQVLPTLQGHLQYVVPQNLAPLLSVLHGANLKSDPRLVGFSAPLARLNRAAEAVQQMMAEQPDWFVQTHHSHKLEAAPAYALPRLLVEPRLPVRVDDANTVVTVVDDTEQLLESGVSCSSTSSVGSTNEPEKAEEEEEEEELEQVAVPPAVPTVLPEETAPRITELPEKAAEPEVFDVAPKWRVDPNSDSGLVSDTDLQLISAS